MVCPTCHAANPDDLRFCGQCGRVLPHAADDAQTVMLNGSAAAPRAVPAEPATAAGLITPPPGASQSATWGAPVPGAAMPTNLAPGTRQSELPPPEPDELAFARAHAASLS